MFFFVLLIKQHNCPKIRVRHSLIMFEVVTKANSTMDSSWWEAAIVKTEKMFFHPDLMFGAWRKKN